MELHSIAKLFPEMTKEEYRALVEDIRENGVRLPVIIHEGKILDGRHRWQACEELGIQCPTKTWSGAPWLVAQSLNLRRRNISADGIAAIQSLAAKEFPEIATEIRQIKEKAQVSKREHEGRPSKISKNTTQTKDTNILSKTGRSSTKIGEAVGVSGATIRKVQELERIAPEKIKAVAEGKISSTKALKEVKRAVREAAKKADPDAPKMYELIHADFRQAAIAENSIDIIITDPPYPKEYLLLFGDLGAFAARVLKDGGSLLVMAGQSYLPAVIAALQRSMEYHWTMAYLTPGGQSVQLWQRKINTFWKPVLWFVKGEYKGDWSGDVVKSNPNDNDKDFHGWGQSESGMADLMKRFVYPGQTVLDPFLGGGTTGVVALKSGCKFIGIDSEKEAVDRSEKRLSEL